MVGAACHHRALGQRPHLCVGTAVSNRTYTVQFKDALDAPLWSLLTNLSAAPQTLIHNEIAPSFHFRGFDGEPIVVRDGGVFAD